VGVEFGVFGEVVDADLDWLAVDYFEEGHGRLLAEALLGAIAAVIVGRVEGDAGGTEVVGGEAAFDVAQDVPVDDRVRPEHGLDLFAGVMLWIEEEDRVDPPVDHEGRAAVAERVVEHAAHGLGAAVPVPLIGEGVQFFGRLDLGEETVECDPVFWLLVGAGLVGPAAVEEGADAGGLVGGEGHDGKYCKGDGTLVCARETRPASGPAKLGGGSPSGAVD